MIKTDNSHECLIWGFNNHKEYNGRWLLSWMYRCGDGQYINRGRQELKSIFPSLKLKSKTFGKEIIKELKAGRLLKLFGEIEKVFSAGE